MDSLSELPLVSVCIPARNGAKQLDFTLRNLQERSNYPSERVEILVGDHGSEDGTAEILARWPRVRRIPVAYSSPNRAMVRNSIVDQARGDILLFIDHDVLVSEQLIAAHVGLHQRYPDALVAGLTFGKDFVKGDDVARLVNQLDLTHIQNSHGFLKNTDQLGDPRASNELLGKRKEEPCDLRSEAAPWRFFWTCNLSARATTFRECNGFDERYDGWGVEDDALSLQFFKRDLPMLFTRAAWAFHIPHEVDVAFNLVNWQRNSRLLFRGYPTRSFEYYLMDGLHGRQLPATMVRLERTLESLREIDVEDAAAEAGGHLHPTCGRRLAWLAPNIEVAVRLGATDAFMPYCHWNDSQWTERGVRCWSLFGITTHFEDSVIDESVVLADSLLLLDRHLVLAVLAEMARVSRRVVIVCGPACRNQRYARGLAMLQAVVELVRFRELEWLGDGNHPRAEWNELA